MKSEIQIRKRILKICQTIGIRSAIFISVLIWFISCTNKPESRLETKNTENTQSEIKAGNSTNPLTVLITNPIKINLDTCPSPRVIKLGTPEIKPAGFFVQMQNYSTDDGLALSALYCGYMDRNGNLWFGTAGSGASRYDGKSFTNYTTDQGLAHIIIRSITEDKNGNIWFGTGGGGVSRYDGKTFTNYTTKQGLAHDEIRTIIEDKNGHIWIATSGGGVTCYDPLAEKSGKKFFTNYTTDQGLASNIVRCIMEDKNGNIWFGTGGAGVSRYDGKSFTNYTTAHGLPSNDIRDIAEDRKGNIWFGTLGGGISRLAKEMKSLPIEQVSFKNYSTAQGLAHNDVISILQDGNGDIWFGTNGGGVSRYSPSEDNISKNPFVNYTTSQGLANNAVADITEDKSGNLWFSTFGAGLSRFNSNGSFTNYTTKEGLPNSIVWNVLEDKNQNIWLGAESGGVAKLDKNGKTFTYYNAKQGLTNKSVRAIFEDSEKNIWFGTAGDGVFVLDKDQRFFTNYNLAQGLKNNQIISITEDKNGNIWLGTDGGGAYSLDKNKKTFTNYTTAQGLLSNIVWRILEDKDSNMWLATFGGGVSRLNKEREKFTNFTADQGLPNNDVLSILEDKKGYIWFGTTKGISRYDPLASVRTGSKSFKNYNTTEGLADNVVTQILEDKNGKIWIGTNKGICSLIFKIKSSSEENQNKAGIIPGVNSFTNVDLQNYIPVFDIYNHLTGYPIKDVNAGHFSMCIDSKGTVWAGTGDEKTGLVNFYPSTLGKNKNLPKVVIQSIKIKGEKICWNNLIPDNKEALLKGGKNNTSINGDSISICVPPNITEEVTTFNRALTKEENDIMRKKFNGIYFDSIDRFYPIPRNLTLPYKHNNITFDFAAIETAKPFLVNYQYILEGYDREWSPITEKSTATFGNIYEGTYSFKVKAQSPEGVWSQPVVYTFTVLPPWFRTWWAYVIYGVVTFFLLFRISHWRTASLRRDKEILEKTVQERTAEMMKHKSLVEEKNKELEKLSIVAKETANGVFITDENGELEWFNEGFSKLFGWKSIEEYKKVRGATIFVVSENEEIAVLIKESISQKKSITYENPTFTKNRTPLWIQTTLTPIFDQYGKLNKLVFVETDITALKNSEEQLLSANKELEAFSYSVSHDLRAPLRAINGYSKILLEDYLSKIDSDGESALNAILSNSKRMGELIDNLLEFSRLGRTEIVASEINMKALVKSVIEEQIIEDSNRIKFTIKELLPSKGTPSMIKQVWINLISNAIKYSKNKPKTNIEIGSYSKDNMVVYYIKDNGAGFNMEYYDKLFGVFQRLHSQEEFEGTGIGLAIVQKIIHRHNGTVWAESKLNKGSCFYFTLPAIES